VFGASVRTLAVFLAVSAALAAVIGYAGARRQGAGRFAWLLPLAVLALGPVPPRYVFAAVLALAVTELAADGRRRRALELVLGLGWGLLALFGLDMFVWGGIVTAGAFVAAAARSGAAERATRPRPLAVAAGLAAVGAAALLVAAVRGALGGLVWDTMLSPLATAGSDHAATGVLRFGWPADSGTVFSQLFTGEAKTAAWPGQGWQRALAYRAAFLVILAAPPAMLLGRRRLARTAAPLLGGAVAGWLTLAWRNDVVHVTAAFYGTLLLGAVALGGVGRRRSLAAAAAGVLAFVVLGAPLGERLWLATHLDRPTLTDLRWPTAQVRMAPARAAILDDVLERLDAYGHTPLVAWPAQPGIVFLSGRRPAVPQVTLLAGTVRDEEAVVAGLRAAGEPPLVLGRAFGVTLGGRAIQDLAPVVWTALREDYVIADRCGDITDGFQIIRSGRDAGVDPLMVAYLDRLPGTAQQVKNSLAPELTDGTTVGQTFPVGGLDLSAITVALAVGGPLPAELGFTVTVQVLDAAGAPGPPQRFRTRITQSEPVQACNLAFGPVPGTAGRRVQVTIACSDPGANRMRLLWRDAALGARGEVFPGGTALVDGRPVDADLYFISY